MGTWKVELWTDGACSGNPGPGGYAALLVARTPNADDTVVAGLVPYVFTTGARVRTEDVVLRVARGGEPETTNNRMELQGIIEGLRLIERPIPVTVYSDSTYAIGVLSGKFKAKANRDLIQRWKEVSTGFTVKWRHINGHSDHPLNDEADRIAVEERDGYKPPDPS